MVVLAGGPLAVNEDTTKYRETQEYNNNKIKIKNYNFIATKSHESSF